MADSLLWQRLTCVNLHWEPLTSYMAGLLLLQRPTCVNPHWEPLTSYVAGLLLFARLTCVNLHWEPLTSYMAGIWLESSEGLTAEEALTSSMAGIWLESSEGLTAEDHLTSYMAGEHRRTNFWRASVGGGTPSPIPDDEGWDLLVQKCASVAIYYTAWYLCGLGTTQVPSPSALTIEMQIIFQQVGPFIKYPVYIQEMKSFVVAHGCLLLMYMILSSCSCLPTLYLGRWPITMWLSALALAVWLRYSMSSISF